MQIYVACRGQTCPEWAALPAKVSTLSRRDHASGEFGHAIVEGALNAANHP